MQSYHASSFAPVRAQMAAIRPALQTAASDIDNDISRGRDGFEAETNVTLFANHILKIKTRKASRGGIYANASVAVREGSFLTHRMYRDFMMNLYANGQLRCTEKAVATMHAQAMNRLVEIATLALEHYHRMDELPDATVDVMVDVTSEGQVAAE